MAKKTKKQVKGNKNQPKRIAALVKARERYEDGNSCGDAVAKAMEVFKTEDGLDVEALTRCLNDNDCKVPNIDMAKNGAIGRFRMVAGLMLRAAAKRRSITIGDQTFGDGERPSKRGKAKRSSGKRGRKAKTEAAGA